MMKPFSHKADPDRLAALAHRAPDLFVQQVDPPPRGMFLLRFNNRKKQLSGYEACECEGTRYSDGFVHLNTTAFPIREFTNLTEMQEVLGAYGDCELTWISEGAAS